MRIDDKTPIGSTTVPTPGAGARGDRGATSAASATPARQGDAAELSQRARDIQKARDAILALPDVREERVAEIRARIARGEYQVSSKDVADRLIESVTGGN